MPQSLSNVTIHLVFSTKDREPFINHEIRDSFHAYLAKIVRDTGSECFRVGGVSDHVHLAIRLARPVSQSELIEKLKTTSSKWIKTQGVPYTKFSWQRGYGVFSISRGHLEALVSYIGNQEEHHRTISFQDEFRKLLQKNQTEFDERYLWD
ncbi:MAG: IS200/IS605 family transposase [Verrucomicrobiaceae bacterium]